MSTSSNIVVMKFGGSSVGSEEGRVRLAHHVKKEQALGNKVVLVVSALGRKPEPYATDSLLSLIDTKTAPPHEIDLIMAVGETISAVVCADTLRHAGIEARALSGHDAGIATDTVDGCASIESINTSLIHDVINSGAVPVVTGFQGMDKEGELKTLGRGGSDTSACALGVALNASHVDIFSDVDGVMSADPRVVKDAQVIECISSQELFEMAKRGSKIVHAPAAELALNSGVRMRVKNTFSDAAGTLVTQLGKQKQSSIATAVSCRNNVARVRLIIPYGPGKPLSHINVIAKAFRILAEHKISIDMATPFTNRLVFIVDSKDAERAAEVLSELSDDINILDDLACVTLVGNGMQGVPGIMADIAEALDSANVDVLQASDSETSVTLLVRQDFANEAQNALHKRFAL